MSKTLAATPADPTLRSGADASLVLFDAERVGERNDYLDPLVPNVGIDAVWVHDHVVWSSEMHRHHISSGAFEAITDTQDANFFEATTILSYLAAETKKITLGVACLVTALARPQAAASLAAQLVEMA